MRLTFHLFRKQFTDFDGLLRADYLKGKDAYRPIAATGDLGYECQAYIQANKAKPPRWAKFLEAGFNVSGLGLVNATSSFVLLLKASDRVFAVTFGSGFHALDRAKVEPDFGLRVALNGLSPDKIKTLEARNVDQVTRQRRTQMSAGSRVGEFGVNPSLDWIRYLGGKPLSEDLGKSISGADSAGVTFDAALPALGAKCASLLDLFESDAYKKHFGFIDYLRPLRKDHAAIPALENALSAKVFARDDTKMSLAFPEMQDDGKHHHFVLRWGTRGREVDELELDDVFDLFHGETAEDIDLSKATVTGFDDQGNPTLQKSRVRDLIAAEIEHEGKIFIHSLGRWFQANPDFVRQTRDAVSKLPNFDDLLDLPPIRPKESEGAYNQRVATAKGWLCLDADSFALGSHHEKIEVCDLVTERREFLCVKKMTKSAPMSHLFSQASVSAISLNRSPRHHDKVLAAINEFWPGEKVDNLRKNVTFVYGIATEKGGDLSSSLYFFSVVNLLEHVRTIQEAGYDVGLCKIPYEAIATVPSAPAGVEAVEELA